MVSYAMLEKIQGWVSRPPGIVAMSGALRAYFESVLMFSIIRGANFVEQLDNSSTLFTH